MLTHNDSTVANALDLLPEVIASGVRHIGFKDVGQPLDVLGNCRAHPRRRGDRLSGGRQPRRGERGGLRAGGAGLGVDVLMGGVRPQAVLPVIVGSALRYYPFPGRITGHPSVLEGPAEDIVASARRSLRWTASTGSTSSPTASRGTCQR